MSEPVQQTGKGYTEAGGKRLTALKSAADLHLLQFSNLVCRSICSPLLQQVQQWLHNWLLTCCSAPS